MQEKFYNPEEFNNLVRDILEFGNIDALMHLNSIVATATESHLVLDPIDSLSLYYIYYIWMPADLKKDFQVLETYLIDDLNTIFMLYFFSDGPKANSLKDLRQGELDDLFGNIVVSIADDIIYKYFNGKIGIERDLDNLTYVYLNKMEDLNYSRISDNYLKILFMGYSTYGPKLFATEAEYKTFTSFLRKKMNFIYLPARDDSQVSIESTLSEMKLV